MRLRQTWLATTATTALIGVGFAFAARFSGASSPATVHLGPFNPLAYWTIQSNLLVGVATMLLALDLNPKSVALRMLYLTGLAAISLTFVVTHTILHDPATARNSWPLWIHLRLCHDIAPVLSVGGWLMFGPRGMFSWTLILPAFVYGLAYDAMTLARGAAIDWYPYAFLDPSRIGYPAVFRTILGFSLVFLTVAAFLVLVDRMSQRRRVVVPAGV